MSKKNKNDKNRIRELKPGEGKKLQEEKIKINPYETKYNVPRIGFKTAVLFFLSALVTAFLPALFGKIMADPSWLVVLIGWIMIGFSIPLGDYFLENKKKVDKKFYILATIFTILSGLVLFLAYYGNKLI